MKNNKWIKELSESYIQMNSACNMNEGKMGDILNKGRNILFGYSDKDLLKALNHPDESTSLSMTKKILKQKIPEQIDLAMHETDHPSVIDYAKTLFDPSNIRHIAFGLNSTHEDIRNASRNSPKFDEKNKKLRRTLEVEKFYNRK